MVKSSFVERVKSQFRSTDEINFSMDVRTSIVSPIAQMIQTLEFPNSNCTRSRGLQSESFSPDDSAMNEIIIYDHLELVCSVRSGRKLSCKGVNWDQGRPKCVHTQD